MSVVIRKGSILDAKVDYIVNPANSHLDHIGGLAAIIGRAACANHEGATAWARDHASKGLVPTGGAVLTSAGALSFNGVIHAVGPVWGGGSFFEFELLAKAHRTALEVAIGEGGNSIAFPAISCGVFGYPVQGAAPVALGVARDFEHSIDVEFWLFSDEHLAAYKEAALR